MPLETQIVGLTMYLDKRHYPDKSNSQELMDATEAFDRIGKAMRRRGVHNATARQATAWVIEDEARELKALKSKYRNSKKSTLKDILSAVWNSIRRLFSKVTTIN
jgi:hypothetical protein